MNDNAASVRERESAPDTTDSDPEVGSDSESLAGRVVNRGRGVGNSSISVKSLALALVAVVLVIGVAALGWKLHAATTEVDDMKATASGNAHAEQVALDYAVGAAEMNFQDLPGWRSKLTAGTSPELTNTLTQAATSMEQIITPLQWVSSSVPVTAKVRSESDGIYVVDCFVSVLTKNSQAPEGIQSTATYSLTLDSANNWTITDVGGIDSAVAPK